MTYFLESHSDQFMFYDALQNIFCLREGIKVSYIIPLYSYYVLNDHVATSAVAENKNKHLCLNDALQFFFLVFESFRKYF